MRRIDLTPYNIRVKEVVEVDRPLDLAGQLDNLLWNTVPWSVGHASEVEAISEKLKDCGDTVEVTDREYELIMQAYEAVRGPEKQILPFLRRLAEAERISVDDQGGIRC